MPGGEFEQPVITSGIRADRRLREDRAGARGDDGGGVSVLVGVDADDDFDRSASMGNAFSILTGTDASSGPVRETSAGL